MGIRFFRIQWSIQQIVNIIDQVSMTTGKICLYIQIYRYVFSKKQPFSMNWYSKLGKHCKSGYISQQQSMNMRSERKARISGLAGTELARNRTLPDLTFPVTEWDLGTRLGHSVLGIKLFLLYLLFSQYRPHDNSLTDADAWRWVGDFGTNRLN